MRVNFPKTASRIITFLVMYILIAATLRGFVDISAFGIGIMVMFYAACAVLAIATTSWIIR